ncbi:MAG: cupin domain-containing protein [Alphaproteobacteria bacterium]|nr:cupin domain-containing protein [Alphaproteobacteria bacterium]
MTLPPNVLRSADHDYQSYGTLPEGYGCSGIELEAFSFAHIGAHLEEVPPGCCSAPLHHHLLEEELFLLLSGRLLARELSPEGEARELLLEPGDLVVYAANTGLAHQFYNPGPEPARFLGLSTASHPQEVAYYPRSGKLMLRGLGFVGALAKDGEAAVAEARAVDAARPVTRLEGAARPAHVASPRFLTERDLGGAFGLPMARLAGARQVFLNRDRLPRGASTGPLHAHSADEELLYVLSGRPTLRQRRLDTLTAFEGPEERVALQAGDLVHWAPGDGVAHQLLNEADEDALLIVIGTDRTEDVIALPEAGELVVRGLGMRGPPSALGYWVGE